MSSFIAAQFVPLLFAGLLIMLLTGFPVAFSLAATGLLFGFIGMEAGLFNPTLFQALPLRMFGIIQNETLLAIPFFTLMGIILEKSGMAEDLLETIGQVFGPVRGGLALAVIFVGALLAATTGVVAAAVISMGLISLPIMLRYGYNRTVATGVITASGTLAQAIPPSLVLIVLADQLGRSVGDRSPADRRHARDDAPGPAARRGRPAAAGPAPPRRRSAGDRRLGPTGIEPQGLDHGPLRQPLCDLWPLRHPRRGHLGGRVHRRGRPAGGPPPDSQALPVPRLPGPAGWRRESPGTRGRVGHRPCR